MSIERTVFLLLAFLLPAAPALAEAPATMRVDFYHSGNHEMEMFSLDQVVFEPLPWTGNMDHPIDETQRGKYLFEIVDPGTSAVAWSRSFSSIYGEWETTREARNMNRTYHESVRFPAQADEFELVLKKRNAQNEFEEIWRLPIDPNDYMVHRESAAFADRVVAILDNGNPATKVDLLILGDGYTEDEHDEFVAKARELADILFTTSPFKERKDDFNVWALAPATAESGVSRPSHRDPDQYRGIRRRWYLRPVQHGSGQQRVGTLSLRPRIRPPFRGSRGRVLHQRRGLRVARDHRRALRTERYGPSRSCRTQVEAPGHSEYAAADTVA
jgi:hypothetical protein